MMGVNDCINGMDLIDDLLYGAVFALHMRDKVAITYIGRDKFQDHYNTCVKCFRPLPARHTLKHDSFAYIIVRPAMNTFDDILYQVSKPARYTGGEWNSIIKDWQRIPLRIALAFPDVYEIGQSNLAIPILYEIINRQTDMLAERVYAPWSDMEAQMRQHAIPLFSLETKHPLKEFDVIGFSLGYELTYPAVLNILDLAGISVFARDRSNAEPLIIAGGSCALNPEPMSDFIDLFVIGESEEISIPLLKICKEFKEDKEMLLRQAAKIPGIYVPSLYKVEYNKNGLFSGITPIAPEAKASIKRQILEHLPLPVIRPVVPFIETVHDRGAIEIQRGCSRGCRFCQAGMIYRPVRELSHEDVINSAAEIVRNCGYNELSLLSLSSGDYHDISGLISKLVRSHAGSNLTISLPSLRIDTSSIGLIESLSYRKKVNLTFAPEAGSERLRRVINKNIPETVMFDTFAAAFGRGWMNLKLYFMIGLPSETTEDLQSIIELVRKTIRIGKEAARRPPRLRVSVSTLVPKAHTPFQWLGQNTREQIVRKQDYLRQGLRKSGAELSWSEPETSCLEAVLARGDRRLGSVIHRAWQLGSTFDTWHEHFNYGNWLKAFADCGLDPAFYANRERDIDEPLPWDHINIGVTAGFLKREFARMQQGELTGDCRNDTCNACGLQSQPACREKYKTTPSTE